MRGQYLSPLKVAVARREIGHDDSIRELPRRIRSRPAQHGSGETRHRSLHRQRPNYTAAFAEHNESLQLKWKTTCKERKDD